MIVLSVLLLAAQASEPALSPAIAIDPCVEVDAEEVRRLTAMELANSPETNAFDSLSVAVTCENGMQELRLVDRQSGRSTARGIDLSSSAGSDRNAKARELALAIAELFRRAAAEEPPEPLPPVPFAATTSAPPPPVIPEPAPEPRTWKLELGLTAVGATWSAGEAMFGAELSGRAHLSRYLIGELRAGGRWTRPVELSSGKLDARGMSGAVGLSFDATPDLRSVGVSFGARASASFLRYAAIDDSGVTYGGGDAAVTSLSGTMTAFVAISEPLLLTVDVAVGGALHSVAIRERDQELSGASGVLLSTAVGLAAQF